MRLRNPEFKIGISHEGDGVARPNDRVYLFFDDELAVVLTREAWTYALAHPDNPKIFPVAERTHDDEQGPGY